MTQVHPVCSVCGVARTDDSPACTSCGHAFSDDDAATGTHAPFFDSARANAETLAGVPVSPRGTGPLIAGQAFGPRYHIIRTLGAGGMGVVYQAWDAELNVAVAVKVIRPEVIGDGTSAAEVERRFKRELVLARQVTHRNVVRIHDLGERDGIKYLTMPFVEGQDLANLLRERGRLPVPEALAIARQVAHGLAAAHQVGVVHRDLKPENIMLAADGTALIMDFGISRSISGTATATALGGVMGTLEYMAPEQARGELVDPRADIYAFGLIFYDMLTGRQRLAGRDNPMSEIMSRMHAAPRALRQLDDTIPESLERIIARCIEPSAEKRFATTSELVATLEALTPDGHPLTLARTPWALIARYCTLLHDDRAFQRGVRIVQMVMVRARSRVGEGMRDLRLPRADRAEPRLDRRAAAVLGVRVRRDLVRPRVVVHNRHRLADRHRHGFRGDAGRGDRDRSAARARSAVAHNDGDAAARRVG